jgi:hypothetical protein
MSDRFSGVILSARGLPALFAHGYRSRVLALFFGRRVAVRLFPLGYIDNRLGELVGSPGRLSTSIAKRGPR